MATRIGYFARRSARRRGEHPEARALTPGNVPAAMLSTLPDGAREVTPQGALSIADAYACIRALADAAAQLPLIAYRQTGNGRERFKGRAADLIERPAPGSTRADLVGQVVLHLNTWGNAYVGKYRDAEGRIEQLGLLRPDRVTVALADGAPIFTFTDPATGRQSRLTTADVCHVKALSSDGLVGLSPVRQARAALGLSSQLVDHASAFFTNSARPGGILKVPQGTDGDALRRVKAAWEGQHQGGNAHRIAVLTGEASFMEMQVPMEDAQFLGQRELSAQEVARIFRVPPWIIGAKDGGTLTYSNTEQQAQHFVTFSLGPWLARIEQALSADADLSPSTVYLEFLIDGLMRSDAATRAEIYTRALDPETGWLTRAEVRRLENLAPEGDTPA